MKTIRNASLLVACLLTGTALAQAPNQPLNLQLPPSDIPVAASTVASKPAVDAHGNPTSAPGVFYGDHSGPADSNDQRVATRRCDDSTDNQPQLHGVASMGVMGGKHVSGNYQAATFNISKNLGTCEKPSGGLGFTIHVSQSQFHGRGW